MKALAARILLSLLAGLIIHTVPPTFALADTADSLAATSRNSRPDPTVKEMATENAAFWFEKGALYATYGNGAAAVKSFQKAIAIDPGYAEAYFNMGVVYGEMGDYRNALDAVNHAIESRPETGRYYYGRGWIYMRSGNPETALTDIRKAAGLGDPEAKKYLETIAPRES